MLDCDARETGMVEVKEQQRRPHRVRCTASPATRDARCEPAARQQRAALHELAAAPPCACRSGGDVPLLRRLRAAADSRQRGSANRSSSRRPSTPTGGHMCLAASVLGTAVGLLAAVRGRELTAMRALLR
jgi:hypothetical protein